MASPTPKNSARKRFAALAAWLRGGRSLLLYAFIILLLVWALASHYDLMRKLYDQADELIHLTNLAVQAQDLLSSERAMVGELSYALTVHDEMVMRNRVARSLPNFKASYFYLQSILGPDEEPELRRDMEALVASTMAVRDLALEGRWDEAESQRREMEPIVRAFEFRVGNLARGQQQLLATLRTRFQRQIIQGVWNVVVVFIVAIGLSIFNVMLVRQRLGEAATQLIATLRAIGEGDLGARLRPLPWVAYDPMVGRVVQVVNSTLATIEQRIREVEEKEASARTGLETVLKMIEDSLGITHSSLALLEPSNLYDRIVQAVADRFGLLHVAIYSFDETGEYLELRAASSEQGKALLRAHHRVRLDEGIVGYVARHHEPYVGGEDLESIRIRDADFPETRAYLVTPMIARDRVLGVMEVRCSRVANFPRHVVVVLEEVASQLALIVDNAQLLKESERYRREMQRLYGELVTETWQTILKGFGAPGYRYLGESDLLEPVRTWSPEMGQAIEEDKAVRWWKGESESVAVPLHARGNIIGVVAAAYRGGWTPQHLETFLQLTSHLEVALESALLFAESQLRAARERMLSDLSAQFSQAFDMQVLLENAVRELGYRFQLEDVSIFVGPPEEEAEEVNHGDA